MARIIADLVGNADMKPLIGVFDIALERPGR
jgi:hypothetical protein